MRTFVARSGRPLLLITALICLPMAFVRAEGETPGDVATPSGTESAEVGTNNNVGLGLFSRFPLKISAFVQGGYDDNVSTSTAFQQGSAFISGGIAVGYDLGTPRTNLTLSSHFGFTYYTELANNPFEPDINLSMTLSHKVTPRLTLTFSGVAAYQTETDFQYGFGTNRRAGNFFFTQDRFGASYAWAPRFATNTSYSIAAVQYDDIAAGLFEDRVEHTFGNEFRFLAWPTTNLVGEYRFQVVRYEFVDRDSTTHYLLGGFDHVFTPRLSAVFRGGAQIRNYENFEEQESPYFEGNLIYKLGKDTSVGWNFHYGIEEGDVATNNSRQSFRTGLQARHDITARINASLSVYYYHDDYTESTFENPGGPPIVTPSFAEESFAIDLAVRYAVTRYLGVEAGYNHNEVTSGSTGGFRDYSRNRVWTGINFAF